MNWLRELFGRGEKPEPQASTPVQERDPEVQFHLGLMCSNRQGEAQDNVQAAQWYLKAARLNHPLAQFNLGLMYANGQGVDKDERAAMMWIRKAAEQGDAGAQFNLGTRCHRSSVSGSEMDESQSKIESYKWLQLANAQGYEQAGVSCERVTLAMSFEEVAEGNRRVAAFVPAKTASKLP